MKRSKTFMCFFQPFHRFLPDTGKNCRYDIPADNVKVSVIRRGDFLRYEKIGKSHERR